MRARAVIAACLAVGAAAGSAEAATTYCVGFERAGCTGRPTAAQAFADAVDGDTIELGALTATSALSSAKDITVAGSGEGRTVLQGGLTLSSPGAELSDLTVHGLRLTGIAARLHVEGLAELRGNAALLVTTVRGNRGIDALDGAPRLESVLLDLSAGPGLQIRCDARLQARHVTLVGAPDALVTTACASSVARVADSILWGPPSAGFRGPGRVITDHTNHRPVAGHVAGAGDRSVDPGFATGGVRLAPGSPLVDAGAAEPLGSDAGVEDRAGLPRIADGDGDGTLVRDMGAYELAPPAVPLPEGNLLGDPGAEHGGSWTLTGGFTRERYGSPPFPSAATGTVLGGGKAFFAGGAEASAAARQVVSVHRLAPEIDAGTGTTTLAALLGGYRSDADTGAAEAAFLDPRGRPIGTATLSAPTPAERAQVTSLLARTQTAPIPPLTRAVAVTLRATRATKNYNDAYFDNVALTASAPGVPPPLAGSAKPFAGLRVLTAGPRLDRRGRIALRVGCPSRTVGRCAGVVTLAGPNRLAAAPVRVRAGRTRTVRLQLPTDARRAVRQKRRVRMRVYVAVRDGQGVVHTSVAPVVVRRRR